MEHQIAGDLVRNPGPCPRTRSSRLPLGLGPHVPGAGLDKTRYKNGSNEFNEVHVDQPSPYSTAVNAAGHTEPFAGPLRALLIYLVAFVTGAIVMSFEMLGSRYLNPYFGSGIYTWAALIS